MSYESRSIYYREPVDLELLTRRLKMRITCHLLEYRPGRAQIRDAVVRELSCSTARAEAMVELLEELGFIRFGRSLQQFDLASAAWQIIPWPPTPIRS